MADDDVLQAKLLSFICGNGGFVDLTVLLKSSSPLGSRKSEESAKKWLESRQGPRAGFACVKDKNGEIVGVRVDLGKKICHRYATKGVCHLRRCRQGTCKNWHICKTFVEGRCNEFCELSHDFYSDDNWEIVEALDLPFYINSNESMKKIVSWNLPQVCALYQRNECTWSECPYIHVCTQFIKASSHSNCFLPHDFEDSHNFAILEKYDLIPSSQVVNIDCIRSNVLIVEEQKRINTAVASSDPASEQNQPSSLFPARIREEINQVNNAQLSQILVCKEQQVDELLNCKMPRAASTNHLPTENALETTRLKSNVSTTSTAVDSQTSLSSSQRINTAVVGSDPVSEQNQPSSLFTAGVQEEIDQVNTAQVAQILVCEEQQVDELLNCKMPRPASTNNLPGESASGTTLLKSNMLTTSTVVDSQTSLPSSQRINTAVFGSDPVSEQKQPSSLFTAGVQEEIDQVNTSQVAQILVCEEQQVDELMNFKMPRAASSNDLPGESASGTTLLKSNMLTTSTVVDSQTSLPSSQRINTAVVGSDPVSEQNQPSSLFTAGVQEEIDQVNTAQVAQILVCEEQQVDELLNRKMPRAASSNDLPGESASGTTLLKSNMLTTSTVVDSQTSLPSSQRINTAVVGSDPVSEKNQPSSLFTAGVQEEIDQVNTAQVAQILVCEEQQVDELLNCKMLRAASTNDLPGESASGTTLLKSNMLAKSTAVDSQTSLPSSQRINTAVFGSDPVSEQNQPSSLFTAGVQEEIDPVNTVQFTQVLVCEEQQVDELLNRKMPRAASSNDLLGESASGTTLLKSNMLTTSTVVDSQTSLPSSQRINTAVVGSDPVSEQNQPSSLFTAGVQEEIDQVNTAQVAQILVCEEQQVDELLNRKMPRAASSNDLPGESASGTTLLKSNMLTTSTVVDSQTSLPSSQRINTAVVGSDPVSEKNQPSSLFTAGVQEEIDQVNTAQVAQILVCEEQQVDELLNRKMPRAASTNNLPGESASATTLLKSNMLTTVDSQTLLPSSQTQEVSEFKSSVPSTHCFLTEWRVFECLCKEYGSSASIQDIAGRKDLFPNGVESAEGWFREMTEGSFLITRGSQGTIAEVSAFSARARICVSYNENGRCHRPDCSFLHICRDFVTDSCSNGVTCPQRHYFHNSRDKAFLSRIKLDQFNDQQLRQLVLSSTPRICVEYNNGICDRGDDCNRIHMCCGHIRKCCSAKSECGLDHEEAMDTKHTQAVLRRYLLHNVEKREAIAMILDDKLCLSGKEKAKGQYLFVLFLFTY